MGQLVISDLVSLEEDSGKSSSTSIILSNPSSKARPKNKNPLIEPNSFKLIDDSTSEKCNSSELLQLMNQNHSISTQNQDIFDFIKSQKEIFKQLDQKPLMDWVLS